MATYPFGYVDRTGESIGDASKLQGKEIQLSGQSNDDLLQYNAGTNRWEYKSVGEVLGIVGGLDNQIILYDAGTGFVKTSMVKIDDSINRITLEDNSEINVDSGTLAFTVTGNPIITIDTFDVVSANPVSCNVAPTLGDHLCNKTYVDSVADDIPKIGSSTDNAVVRWNGVVGDAIQDSLITIDDTGVINRQSGSLELATGGVVKLTIGSGESYFSDQVQITDTTISTTPATGALVVAGGVGIGDDLFVNDTISCSRLLVDNTKLVVDSIGGETVLEAGVGDLVIKVDAAAPPKGLVLRQQTTDLLTAKDTGITCNVPVLATDINSINTGNLNVITTAQGGASASGNLTASTGTTANGNTGNVVLSSGQPSGNGNSGNVSINSGYTTSGAAGTVSIAGGNSNASGGAVSIKAGSRYSVGNGSNCTITGGDSGSTSGLGGNVVVSGGLGQNDTGGSIEIKSGIGGGVGGSSGTVLVSTPNATGFGSAGTITIRGGNGSGAGSSNGGDIVLEAGASSGASNGGVLFGTDTTTAHLFTRGPAPTVSAGTINSLSTDVAGSVSGLPAGPNSTTITFNKPYRSGAGVIVQITPTSSVGTPLYVSASSTTSFTVQNPNGVAGVSFNYTVMACI